MVLNFTFTNKYINKNFYSALTLLLSSSSLLVSIAPSQANQLNRHNKQLKNDLLIDYSAEHVIASNDRGRWSSTSPALQSQGTLNLIAYNNNQVLPATINLVKQYEGFRSYAYIDTSGLPVIGYGQSRINGRPVRMGQYITRAQADVALAKELYHIQRLVLANVRVKLTPYQLGALTSLVYNAGTRVVKTSTLSRKLNAGDYRGAAQEFVRWNKANQGGRLVAMPGLTKRRIAEKNLFLTPYSTVSSK